MSFLNPLALLLLVLVPAVFWAERNFQGRRASALNALGRPVPVRTLRMFIAPFLVLSFILAISRPYYGFHDITLPTSSRDISLLVDVSRSMLTRDQSPSRMEFAKRKIVDLIDYIRLNSPGDRIGLILFAGDAYLFCPLTSDYSALEVFAKAITPDLITAQGSSLGVAFDEAVKSLKNGRAASPDLLLLSDGEDSTLEVDKAVSVLNENGMKVDAIGIGTPEGAPIEIGRGAYLKDRRGEIVVSKLNEESLKALASRSGGGYLRATLDTSDIEYFLKRLRMSDGHTEPNEKKIRSYDELGPLFLWAPLAIILMAVVTKRSWVVFLLLIICAPKLASAEGEAFEGYKAYANGDFEEALKDFKKAKEAGDSSPELAQAYASSLYKTKRFTEASKEFQKIASEASSGREKFEALYNLGNSQVMEKKFEEAIKSYDEALKIKSEDNAAASNRALAQSLLEKKNEERKKKEQEKKDSKDEENKEKEDSKQDSSEKPQENKDGSENKKSSDNSEEKQDPSSSVTPAPSPTEVASTGGGEPTPAPTSGNSDSGGDGTETAAPTALPTSSDGDNGEPKSGASGDGSEAPAPSPVDPRAMSEAEARAWLESLPDSPVLLKRKVSRPVNQSEQTW